MEPEVVAAVIGVIGVIVAALAAFFGSVYAAKLALGATVQASKEAADATVRAAQDAVQQAERSRVDPFTFEVLKEQLVAYQQIVEAAYKMDDRLSWGEAEGEDLFDLVYRDSLLQAWKWRYGHLASDTVMKAVYACEEAFSDSWSAPKERAGRDMSKVREQALKALVETVRTTLHVGPLERIALRMISSHEEMIAARSGVRVLKEG